MATGYYQTPLSPRLYVSYPLFAHATGGLSSAKGEVATDTQMINMIQLDPANYQTMNPLAGDSSLYFGYKLVSDNIAQNDSSYGIDWWNFNYAMVLGHNLADHKAYPMVQSNQSDATNPTGQSYVTAQNISSNNTTTIQNYQGYANEVLYNGWSALEINNKPTDPLTQWFVLRLVSSGGATLWPGGDLKIGSILFGKYFQFPQNVDINTSLSYEYDYKTIKTKSGKQLTSLNTIKPNSWVDGNEPFGLSEEYTPNRGDLYHRKTGQRVWKMSWTELNPKYIMNQNPMLNSLGWSNKDNYQSYNNDESIYNIKDSNDGDSSLGDFYTDVIHKTLGGSLPMVLQLDKNDASPSNMAIVKMTKPPVIAQKSPNLYSISIELEEQI